VGTSAPGCHDTAQNPSLLQEAYESDYMWKFTIKFLRTWFVIKVRIEMNEEIFADLAVSLQPLM
jgi:hypothetical protein